jgi:hypothetical protein
MNAAARTATSIKARTNRRPRVAIGAGGLAMMRGILVPGKTIGGLIVSPLLGKVGR